MGTVGAISESRLWARTHAVHFYAPPCPSRTDSQQKSTTILMVTEHSHRNALGAAERLACATAITLPTQQVCTGSGNRDREAGEGAPGPPGEGGEPVDPQRPVLAPRGRTHWNLRSGCPARTSLS